MTGYEMVDAVAVWPTGRTQKGRARSDRVRSAADAIALLNDGAPCVYVAPEDAERVRVRGAGDGETVS